MEKKAAMSGSWSSPITAEKVASGTLRFSEVKLDDGKVYWLEHRPFEGGRRTLMSWSEKDGEKELLPQGYSIKTKVHEYGGGALLVERGRIFFVNDKDQQIYHLKENGELKKITNLEKARFADGCIDKSGRFLYYVMEEHQKEVLNTIVQIDLETGQIHTLASGNDFYSSPRIGPDGNLLAYISWDHPNMPWDGTDLWVLDLKSFQSKKIAGGKAESVLDPKWSPDGKLYYVSDKGNWWNITCDGKQVYKLDAEFALAHWTFGRSLMGLSKDGIFCSYVKMGASQFADISLNGEFRSIELPFTAVSSLSVEGGSAAVIASSAAEPLSVVLYDLKERSHQIIKCCRSDLFDRGFISQPNAIEFTSCGRKAHAFYYPPTNPNFKALPNEKPPLLVSAHGGPTGHCSPAYNPEILFWTSRGFAYLDVNYGGSTGYGREYRDSLKGKWGIVDVDDCLNAALYCANEGLADPDRLCIAGPSAGGFTTLAAVVDKDVFKVGADYFGVSDLERLALDTHKFESRYLDGLIGPYPQDKQIYINRSPIYNVDKISCPIIILQGDKDEIVPPSQSEMMFKSLSTRGIPTAYLLYEGEGHGFLKAENIKRSLEAQVYFFSKILKFPLSEEIQPLKIENLN